MKVSDLIKKEDVETWNHGEVITITAGTGKGKSHFIKNDLYDYVKQHNKRILMLIHRINCVSQFEHEINRDGKQDIIDIHTYQRIEAVRRNENVLKLDEYDYIICDEFHYFMGDASFNNFTDLSFEAIISSKATKIFMSATGDKMRKYLNKHRNIQTVDYVIERDFSFIEQLEFYRKDETLEMFIQDCIENNKKVIVFFADSGKAYSMYKKYSDYAMLNVAEGNRHYKYVNERKVSDMLHNEKFDDLLLFTTSVMDAGINIHDDELKNIIIDGIKDIDVLIQCMGRKRLKEDEKIILTVRHISNQQLGGLETKMRTASNKAAYLKEYGTKAYSNKYSGQKNKSSDPTGIVYTVPVGDEDVVEFKTNDLRLFKISADVQELENMKTYEGKNRYCDYLGEVFGMDYVVYEEIEKQDDLESYLDGLVGEKLFKNEQRELVDKINLRDNKRRQQKSIGLLNEYLKENKVMYQIVSKRSMIETDGIKKKKSYWEVIGDVNR